MAGYCFTHVALDNIELTKRLEGVADWKKVCVFLLDDKNGDKVPRIERSNFFNVEACRAAMIVEFLDSGERSWEKVLSSLRSAGYKNLASDIEKTL